MDDEKMNETTDEATEETTDEAATDAEQSEAGAGNEPEKAPSDAAVSEWEKRYSDLEQRYEEQGKRLDTLLDSVAKLVNANVRLGGAAAADAPKRNEPTADEKALNALMGE